ncbi:MAG: cysteine--tRNA ligase [Cyanobacteria bacterium]|nr:cysteine--tRNA ligase [Cyanobacteriota bacterium]MDA1020371.1 cysteine--tRNA ligase [Cyanobacteriota bacterium]
MRIFNNLSRKIEEFEPVNAPQVFIYSCGPTVYDVSHIGHARSTINWDLLYRYLNHKGYKTKWIRNITNIDDKIVARATEQGISADKLSRIYTQEFWADMKALNVSWPDFEPRATDFLPEMIKFIEELIDQGFAYKVENLPENSQMQGLRSSDKRNAAVGDLQVGYDVYFRVSKHQNYGQLKGQNLEQLRDGLSRVDPNSKKEDQLDFALWKSFPNDDSSFESPWGLGRPGWHLECSSMIRSILKQHGAGDTLDIHAGGDDLVHPHHENECAQSESLSGKPLAKYWMHNGMVMINGSKMSKSEGNYFTIKDVLAKYKANSIRYFCLSTHYKKQINFSHEALEAAETGFESLISSIKGTEAKAHDKDLVSKFNAAMDDDLNSAKALALLFENKDSTETVAYLLEVLGFDLSQKSDQDNPKITSALDAIIRLLLKMRDAARNNKDFATSDKIRNSLTEAGISIKDHRDQETEWSLT